MAALSLAAAACGGDDDDAGGSGGTTGSTTGVSSGTTSIAPGTSRAPGITATAAGEQYAEGEPRKGGEITVGMESVLTPLDPAGSSSNIQLQVAVHGELLRYSPDGESFEGILAEGIEMNDDGTEFTLTLRPGIEFSNGAPFNAQAVVAHWDHMLGEDSRWPYKGSAAKVQSWEAVDDLTVKFTNKTPYPAFPDLIIGQSLGFITAPGEMEAKGQDYGLDPVGAGPFLLDSWSEQRIVVVRNPNYFDPEKPYLDRVTFVPSLDSQAELAGAQTGDIDIALTQSDQDFARAEANGVKVLRQRSFTPTVTMFQTQSDVVNDVRVRRALAMAVDNQVLVDTVYGGLRDPAHGHVPPSHPYYDPAAEADFPKYDPEEARRLIQEYEQETGKQVAFEFDNWDPPEFQQMYAVIQQMWNAVGADITLRPLGQAELVKDTAEGTYIAQSRYHPWLRIPPDGQIFSRHHSSSTNNPMWWHDAANDAAIDALLVSTDEDVRKAEFNKAVVRLSQEMPFIPHTWQTQAYYLSDEIKGFPGGFSHSSTSFPIIEVWV